MQNFQQITLLSMRRSRQEHNYPTEAEPNFEIIHECLKHAVIAHQKENGKRKMTEDKFKMLFDFQRNQTGIKPDTRISAFMKKIQQKVLRKFIELCSWRINQIRKIKNNQMSLSQLKKKHLKYHVSIKEIQNAHNQLISIQDFVSPLFTKQFCKIETKEEYQIKKKQMTVELFIILKIKDIIYQYLHKKHSESVESVIYQLDIIPVGGYGQQKSKKKNYLFYEEFDDIQEQNVNPLDQISEKDTIQ